MSPVIGGPAPAAPGDLVTVEGQVLTLLGGVPDLDTYDGYVRDSDESAKTISAPLPYAIVYFTPGRPINRRLASNGKRAHEFQVTGVGETREQASWAAQQAEDALDGTFIDLNGRQRRIRRTDDDPYIRRDDVWTSPGGRPLFNDSRRYRTRT